MLALRKKKFTILFLSANFKESTIKTRIDKEFKIIKKIIEKSPFREFIHLEPAFATERNEFFEYISRYQPQMIHFAGHGELSSGFYFEDDVHFKEIYDSKFLLEDTVGVLKNFKNKIKIVIFNSCESLKIAKKVSEFLPCSVGTKRKIYDNHAITFSEGFYEVFCNNDKIENAFKSAIRKYKLQSNIGEDDYQLFCKDSNTIENGLEDFLNISLEQVFLEEFDKNLRDTVEWAIIFIVTLNLDNKILFINNLYKYLDKFLQIKIKDSNRKEIIKKVRLIELREIVSQIIAEIVNFYEDNTIQKEKFFDKLFQTLSLLKGYYEKNPSFFEVISSRLISKLGNLNTESIDWRSQLDFTIENFKIPLWRLRAKNHNEIIEFEDDVLLNYCLQQLELVDLASRFETRFNLDLFEKDPDLENIFEIFFRTIKNPQGKNRIFLLLGHMGLGKTWNASYLAFEYIKQKKIPTFYFHLRSYEDRFENILGGFNKDSCKIPKLLAFSEKKKRDLFLIFDGFEELTEDERGDFLNNLCDLIDLEKNYEHLIILLTSRLVDWINTKEIIRNYRQYKRYIFQNDKFNNFEDNDIPTGTSYILSDIKDLARLKKINKNYGINYEKVKDKLVKRLLMKPFIIRIIFESNVDISEKKFNPIEDEWYNLFESRQNENTILNRMGIVGTVENDFKDLVSIIADPYTPILDNELSDFKHDRKGSWDVIYSSGIIKIDKTKTQFKYYFQEEYQGFIEHYSSKLKQRFQEFEICKSDANSLEEIEVEIGNHRLRNLSDFEELKRSQGYVIDINDRVSELYLDHMKTKRIPKGVYKLIGLKKLDLQDNDLPKLPKDIGRLKNLEILNLDHNELKELPDTLTKLDRLYRMNIQYNNIKSINSWWHEFKDLKFVNLMKNTYISYHPKKQTLPSIDYIDDNLLMVDDRIETKGQITPILEKINLKVKDAVIIDYLNHLKDYSSEFSYWVTISNEYICSLTLKIPKSLLNIFEMQNYYEFKELFWSLEELESLELKGELIKFGKSTTIKNLKIIDIQGKGHQFVLNLHESISLLKNLESIYIENFFKFNFPECLKSCSKLSEIIINSQISNILPDIVFKWEMFQNILINTSQNLEDINDYMVQNQLDSSRILVNLHTQFILNELTIPSHIKKVWIKVLTRFPKNVSINGRLKKLLITNQENLTKEFFKKLNFWKISEKGIYFFGFSRDQTILPDIISNFKRLNHLRIDFPFVTDLKDWVFLSPNIKKMLISEDPLPSPNEDFLNDSNKGIFLVRVRNNCKLPKGDISMKIITHLRINLPQLTVLPNFLGNLSQFTQLLITSINFKGLTEEFGSEETKYRLEIRVSGNCALNESFKNLEKLTHIQINNNIIKDLPNSWENLQDLSYIRWINPPIVEIPELIAKLSKINKLHISFIGTQGFRKNFWLKDKDNRLEISIPHKSPIQLSHIDNITHLRVSGFKSPGIFNLQDSNLNNITYLRIDQNNFIPTFIRECQNLFYLELNTELIDQLPRDLMHFKQIQQFIITDKLIEFSNDFWNPKDICTFKIKVKPNCKFPNFLHELSNLTHLWVELPELRILPEDLKKFKENDIDLRIYTDKEIEISLDDYLTLLNPKFYIIKVAPNCSIPDSLK